jgi:hypothetical protein
VLSSARRKLGCQRNEAWLAPFLTLEREIHLLVQIGSPTRKVHGRPIVIEL